MKNDHKNPRPTLTPPLWATALLARAAHLDEDGRSIVGDLYEEFLQRAEGGQRTGPPWATFWAKLWFCWQAIALSTSMLFFGRARNRRRRNNPTRVSARTSGVAGTINSLTKDLRFALRRARRNPTFSIVATLSLAIGIGSCALIFSLINATLLRPTPGLTSQHRIVEISRSENGNGKDTLSYPEALDLRRTLVPKTLEGLAVFTWDVVSFNDGTGSDRLSAMYVSANYLSVLGVQPSLGQGFSGDWDEHEPPEPVVIVSHRFWTTHLTGDTTRRSAPLDGAVLRLGGRDLAIIGVLPQAFEGHLFGFQPDVLLPLGQHSSMDILRTSGNRMEISRASSWLFSLARLAPDATLEEANQAVASVYARLATDYPSTNRNRGGNATSYGPVPAGVRSAVSGFFAFLLGLVILIMLITCANVAGMLLASAAARQREIAIRTAVGCSRTQLVRQLACESGLLFLVGGLAGTLLAYTATKVLTNMHFAAIPVETSVDLSLDWRGVVFSLCITLFAALLFGLLPALQSTRSQFDEGLRSTVPVNKLWIRKTLVVAQVAASMVLLVTAGLFLRSIQAMANTPTGFSAQGISTASIDPSLDGIDQNDLHRRLEERLRAIPGVESVAFATDLPLDLATNGYGVEPEGWRAQRSDDSMFGTSLNFITPSYQETLGIRQLEGRGLRDADRFGAEPVALVSREFAHRAWPEQSALSRWIDIPELDPPARVRVVGVIDNVKSGAINDQPRPTIFLPIEQATRSTVHLFVRSNSSHNLDRQAIRQAVIETNPDLSHTLVLTLEQATSLGSVPQRAAAAIAIALGMVALFLSALGLYGVVSFSVALRTNEIGVRMALGAGANRVLSSILRNAASLAIPGLAIGLALGLGVAQIARSLLVGVNPLDPWSLLGALAVVAIILLCASWIPARRAAHVDPARALRPD